MAVDHAIKPPKHIHAAPDNSAITKHRTWGDIKQNIIWGNVARLGFFHLGFVAALIIYAFRLYTVPIQWKTIFWVVIITNMQAIGITAGSHRLWSHRTYKAKLPLRIMLMVYYSLSGMNSIFAWVKDHRVHHKYSETDADPHNAKRGFFYAHMGWLMMKRTPEYLLRGREVDMTDIMADPVAMFEKRNHTLLKWTFCFIVPTLVPVLFWQESIFHAVLTQCFLRHVFNLHVTWSINSAAHLWGNRPYNKSINPADNWYVSILSAGEGSHNYHHTFPWDYKASEFPYINFNSASLFIDVMAKLGWAYDRRQPSKEFVNKVVEQLGHKSKIHMVY